MPLGYPDRSSTINYSLDGLLMVMIPGMGVNLLHDAAASQSLVSNPQRVTPCESHKPLPQIDALVETASL
jgi:hypothetical protein